MAIKKFGYITYRWFIVEQQFNCFNKLYITFENASERE